MDAIHIFLIVAIVILILVVIYAVMNQPTPNVTVNEPTRYRYVNRWFPTWTSWYAPPQHVRPVPHFRPSIPVHPPRPHTIPAWDIKK